MMKKPGNFLILVAVAALGAGGWFGFRHARAQAVVVLSPHPPTPVTVTQVTQGKVQVDLSGLGHVQAYNQVTIKPQIGGQITQIPYKQGAVVQKNAVLVRIDPRPFQARLDQDKANLLRDDAHLTNAAANLSRYEPLAREGYASVQQAETQASMVSQAQAAIAADKAVIEQDQLSLDYATIRSPITGVAGLRLVDVGNVVQPNEATGLLTVTQVQPIAVLFTLPQTDLPDVQAQVNQGGAQLPVEAWSQDGRRKLATGRLTVINNTVDSSNGTITLRSVFANTHRMLWPGEFVQARVILKLLPNGLTVPASVVQRGPSGPYVWVVRNKIAEMQPVTVAQIQQGRALVTAGLHAGETVVTDGQYGLTPGATVAVQASNPTTPLQNAQTEMLGIQP
ncbi:MAG TPA: efflux RND transporter periplasmic adaptor subunit [Acidisoma sp.]|uniref:efflux RND transporter periplasmic adaptor subunit n=1 Tax=Acidisoma sp. TaxID=1872115 RepID=UPI002C30BBBE|nr:efflux RND transporter periplasmic adaptor subunit [Acidisoma sp.]HTI00594.1 efflux RND transporter periplasmic adaptor subunit [Acidisoma sp.]